MSVSEYEVYGRVHQVNVFCENETHKERKLLLTIVENKHVLRIKARDVNDYRFNYCVDVDEAVFAKIKRDQCLDIDFFELKTQILDLLRLTETTKMSLRFVADEEKLTIMFYEKTKLKSLVFLSLDLHVTDQNDVIKEMMTNIQQLKEQNSKLKSEVFAERKCASEKQEQVKMLNSKLRHLREQCVEHLVSVDRLVNESLQSLQSVLEKKISKLDTDFAKVVRDADNLKEVFHLKSACLSRLNRAIIEGKAESEKQQKTIEELQERLDCTGTMKLKAEQQAYDLKLELARTNERVENMTDQIDELKRDMQNATLIIAQKGEINDELAKDLVQANQMIVSFKNRLESISEEENDLRKQLGMKDEVIREYKVMLSKIQGEFESYKNKVRQEDILKLEGELITTRNELQNLEKQNRELAKLNGVLTKKLSCTNLWSQPQQE